MRSASVMKDRCAMYWSFRRLVPPPGGLGCGAARMPAAAPVAPAVTSIVLVEDDPAYAEIMGEGLKDFWPGELHVASVARLSEARAELEGEAADCVLLDLSL